MTEDLENITVLPSGNLRVRVKYAGQVAAKTFAADNVEAACKWRDAVKLELAEGNLEVVGGVSMKQLGPRFLASRSGHRDWKTDESRWYKHIETAEWASRAAATNTRGDGLRWL